MKSMIKKLTLASLTIMFVVVLGACEEGPAEEAGEEIDDTVQEVGNAVEDACENVKDAAETKDQDC